MDKKALLASLAATIFRYPLGFDPGTKLLTEADVDALTSASANAFMAAKSILIAVDGQEANDAPVG